MYQFAHKITNQVASRSYGNITLVGICIPKGLQTSYLIILCKCEGWKNHLWREVIRSGWNLLDGNI